MIIRCAFCPDFHHDTDPEIALTIQLEHRQTKHPELQPRRRRKHRNAITVSDKNVHDNVAAVREQGGARWVSVLP